MDGTRILQHTRGGPERRRTGVVLPTVLVIMLTVCLITGLVARFSIRSMRLARRALDVERAFVVAEAGLGYGVMRVRNMLNAELVSGLQRDYATISAPASPDPEFQLSLKIVLGEGTNEVGSIEVGSQYVTVFAGARNLESGVSCALKQTLLAESKTLSDYAAFWDGDFEANVNKDVPMHFIGKVHANGDIFVSKGAQFDRNITCSGRFYHQRKNTGSRDDSNGNNSWRQVKILRGDDNVMSPSDKDAQGKNGLKNTWDPNKKQFVDSLLGAEWSTERTRYYGDAVKTGDDGVRSITPPLAVGEDNHALIEKPLHQWEEGYDEATEGQKFSRKAALYLKVDEWGGVRLYKGVDAQGYPTDEITGLGMVTPVVVSNYVSSYEGGKERWQRNYTTKHKIRIYGKDETGAYDLSDGNGFFNSEHIYAWEPKTFFVDKRIQWVMKPVDIYLDKMLDNPTIRSVLDSAEANGKERILYVEMDTPKETPVARFNRDATDENPSGSDNFWTTRDDWLEPIPCVRVRNGADLKGCDLSIVTSRHLYVEGDFNTRRNGTETTEVGENGLANVLLAGDTLTTLSKNWQQYHFDPNFSRWDIGEKMHYKWDPDVAKALKFQKESPRNTWIYRILESWQEKDDSPYTYPGSEYQKGVTTTVNSMVMMGMIPSLPPELTGNTDADFYYSGGMENAFRWIEKWVDKVDNKDVKQSLVFNGTLLCLYAPHEYEYRWEYWTKSKGSYTYWWQAPLRTSWAYTRMTPPGLPNFFSVRETEWDRVAWSSVNWDGTGGEGGGGGEGGEGGG
jgi:hypothetical protein